MALFYKRVKRQRSMGPAKVKRSVTRFVARAVPKHIPFYDELMHWTRSKVIRSDLATISLIAALIIWSRYADMNSFKFYQFMTTSFKFEEPPPIAVSSPSTASLSTDSSPSPSTEGAGSSNASKFFESLIQHLPGYFSATIIKHSTATISLVYCMLFIAFLLFSSPIYQLRYIRNTNFSGYSFLVYIIYCWLFISMLSHLPIIHQLVEEPLALFQYFYALSVVTVSTINVTLRIILNRVFVFHIGPRRRMFEVLQSSAFISLGCSMLFANCGNTFDVSTDDDADHREGVLFAHKRSAMNSMDAIDGSEIFCRTLFESVALSGNSLHQDVPPVLTMWFVDSLFVSQPLL